MKKIIPFAILKFCCATSFSQVPGKFNYQAVIRDASGNLRSEVDVAIPILILQGSVTSNPIYIENHNVKTSAFGLVNLALGNGTVDLGTFGNINWAMGLYFIKVKVDGIDYGSSEVLSVPYALYADKAGKIYHTVQIGTQYWLQENMNRGVRIDGSLDQTDNRIWEKYCYDDDEANCDLYGGLYQWNEAIFMSLETLQYVLLDGAFLMRQTG